MDWKVLAPTCYTSQDQYLSHQYDIYCQVCIKYVLYNYQYEVYVNFFFQSQTMEIILYLHVLYYCCPLKRPVSLYECKSCHGITTSAFTHSGNNESSGLYNKYACRMGSGSKLVLGPLFKMLK